MQTRGIPFILNLFGLFLKNEHWRHPASIFLKWQPWSYATLDKSWNVLVIFSVILLSKTYIKLTELSFLKCAFQPQGQLNGLLRISYSLLLSSLMLFLSTFLLTFSGLCIITVNKARLVRRTAKTQIRCIFQMFCERVQRMFLETEYWLNTSPDQRALHLELGLIQNIQTEYATCMTCIKFKILSFSEIEECWCAWKHNHWFNLIYRWQ